MPPEQEHELTKFAASLSALNPSAGELDREQILFEAGRAAALAERRPARWTAWIWPCATAALVVISLSQALLWRMDHQSRPQDTIVEQPTMPKQQVVDRQDDQTEKLDHLAFDTVPLANDYLLLRRQVLSQGAEALPAPKQGKPNGKPLSWRTMLQDS